MVNVKAFYESLLELEITSTEDLVQGLLNQGVPAHKILNEGLIGAMEIVGQVTFYPP